MRVAKCLGVRALRNNLQHAAQSAAWARGAQLMFVRSGMLEFALGAQ